MTVHRLVRGRRQTAARSATLALLAGPMVLLTACSGGSSSGAATSSGAGGGSAAPVTSAPASSAPATSASPSVTASTTTAPAPVASTATPAGTSAAPKTTTAPAPTTTANKPPAGKPLSKYEADPGVKALRAWAAQVGRTVNTGNYTDDALRALMTPELAAKMKEIVGGDVGLTYPGPVPFTPLTVTVTSPGRRDIPICVVGTGFAIDSKTHKPAAKRTVVSIDAKAALVGGVWLASAFDNATFSCAKTPVVGRHW